jgi:hypothetical protein
MPTLYLVCHACHKEFPSTIAITDSRAVGVVMSNDRQQCPHCNVESEYFTHEYHLLETTKPATGGMPTKESTSRGNKPADGSDAPHEAESGDLEALARVRGPRTVIR